MISTACGHRRNVNNRQNGQIAALERHIAAESATYRNEPVIAA
jgi:hypothetical protein